MKTVKDMYDNAVSRNKKLLSDYNAPFWAEYLANHQKYDKLFKRLYFSYKYFMQDSSDTINNITDDFIDEVYNHLLVNTRKYTELYRTYTISDADYSIKDNYRIEEKMDKDTTDNSTNTYGARTDGNTSTHKVVPYNTSSEFEDASVTDNVSKGSQTDTLGNIGTEDYTLTRIGNIGVQTGSDMLKKHNDLWNSYEFYTMIFSEICKELLLV